MSLGAWDVLKDLSEIKIVSSGRPLLTIKAQDERSGADKYVSAYDQQGDIVPILTSGLIKIHLHAKEKYCGQLLFVFLARSRGCESFNNSGL